MKEILTAVRGIAAQLATVILFWTLLWLFGLKVAIAASIVFVVIDSTRRLITRAGFPALYLLTSGLTLVFGAIDLYSKTPFMIKYEAVITNLVIAVTFALGTRGEKSMIQKVAEQQVKEGFPDRADIRAFFKLMTWAWALYFVLRATLYFWMGQVMPIERVLQIRPIIGFASLAVMMVLSFFLGEKLFHLAQRLGLVPRVEEETLAAASPKSL